MSKQLLRSATSIGANIHEAGAAQTPKGFITKMAIASKEARETKYWLRLIAAAFPDLNLAYYTVKLVNSQDTNKDCETAQSNLGC